MEGATTLADFPIRSSGTSQVPLGGRAVASIQTEQNDVAEDVTTVRVIWKSNTGATLSDQTYSGTDISTTASDGGAITITNPVGTGTYQATYTIPNNGTYNPPAAGLQFSVQIIATDEDGTADTGAIAFLAVQPNITVSLDTTSIATTVKRQVGIMRDVEYLAQNTNANIPLRGGIIYGIIAAHKNGSVITSPTNYSWSTYKSYVVVTPAPAIGDYYTFTVQTRSDDFVNDIVERYKKKVISALKVHYDSDSLLASPTVVEIVKSLCVGQLRQDLAEGTALDSAWYRAGRDLFNETMMYLLRIQRGAEGIYDEAEVEIARKSGALVGGQRHADGDFVNRLGLQDRAQQHTGLFLTLHPDPVLAQTRATRGYTTP